MLRCIPILDVFHFKLISRVGKVDEHTFWKTE
jgi:hypothetical protein